MSCTGQVLFAGGGVGQVCAEGGVEEGTAGIVTIVAGRGGWTVLQGVSGGILRGGGFVADWRPGDGDGGVVGVDEDDSFVHCC